MTALSSLGATAQQPAAVAVGLAAPGERYQIDQAAVAMPNDATWSTGDLWKWTGIGALLGAAAMAGWVGLQMTHGDGEAIGISPMTILVVAGGVGAVGGGLTGALAYALAHPAPDTAHSP
ncbi:MAG TPA: hypothetical protein VJW73_17315 [Gemmatimonadaceae bacterium]|nr:hypothetical protein [Gemmatimonadaceae bacterium]